MKVVLLMDNMIEQLHPNLTAKNYVFIVSKSNYINLCSELKRNVRTYKKFKVVSNPMCETDKQYLMNKKDYVQ